MFTQCYAGDKIRNNEMVGALARMGGGWGLHEGYIQSFGGETRGTETTWWTQAQVEG